MPIIIENHPGQTDIATLHNGIADVFITPMLFRSIEKEGKWKRGIRAERRGTVKEVKVHRNKSSV